MQVLRRILKLNGQIHDPTEVTEHHGGLDVSGHSIVMQEVQLLIQLWVRNLLQVKPGNLITANMMYEESSDQARAFGCANLPPAVNLTLSVYQIMH